MVGGGGVQSLFRVQPNCCVEVVLSLGLWQFHFFSGHPGWNTDTNKMKSKLSSFIKNAYLELVVLNTLTKSGNRARILFEQIPNLICLK